MIIEQITNQPVIEAQRFVMRPIRKSDAGLLEMYAGDRRVAEATQTLPHPLPPGATDAYIARAMKDERTEDIWVMDGSKQGHAEVLGVIWMERMDRAQSEVNFWIAPAFWNTGFASEALQAIVEANPQNANTLFAAIFQDNPASARVVTNAGFDYLGDAEAFSVARNTTVPTWTYVKKIKG